jgi:hypothetical protein
MPRRVLAYGRRSIHGLFQKLPDKAGNLLPLPTNLSMVLESRLATHFLARVVLNRI